MSFTETLFWFATGVAAATEVIGVTTTDEQLTTTGFAGMVVLGVAGLVAVLRGQAQRRNAQDVAE
jgi:hypothetical protein